MATYSAPQGRKQRVPAALPELTRRDNWRAAPIATVVTFLVFIAYSTVRAFAGNNFSTFEHPGQVFDWVRNNPNLQAVQPHYWSPFYSPYIPLHLNYPFVQHNGAGIAISAALYVLIIPLSFRLSCYYCRKAYYRAVFGDPSACAVKEQFARLNYRGETRLPAKAFNLHRFALYLALVLVAFHWYHLFDAFHATTADGRHHLYIGVGTLILGLDTLALTAYTFSCHSFRHLTGGVLDFFSRSAGAKQRHGLWAKVSRWNEYHGQFFWASLITVGLADLYVCLVASGAIRDLGWLLTR